METLKSILLPLWQFLFPAGELTVQLQSIPAKLIHLGDYTVLMYLAAGISFFLFVGCLIYGILLRKNGYTSHGTLAIITAVLDSPLVLLSLGGYMGRYVWLAAILPLLFYFICQTIVDSDEVGMNSLICIGVIVFGGFGILLLLGEETPEACAQALTMAIPLGAAASTVFGILKQRHYLSSSRSSRGSSYDSGYYGSTTPYYPPDHTFSDIGDARSHLRSQLDQRGLSSSEKAELIRQHNNKYLDNMPYEN